jgi:hypothetical protein
MALKNQGVLSALRDPGASLWPPRGRYLRSSSAVKKKLFEGHPHFTIFVGYTVEVMPVLPMPGV